MRRLIVGFGHKRRRGKDTAALFAVEYLKNLSIPVRQDAFAFPLKEGIGRIILGLNGDQLYGEAKTEIDKFWGKTPRELLQLCGTEVMRRSFDLDVWVKSLTRRAIDELLTSVVVTDVRFPNEAAAIHELGGLLIRCDRDIQYSTEEDNHESETALDNWTAWDYIIDNNGSLDSLRTSVHEIMRKCFEKNAFDS